jgi:hypothetical protein
VGGEGGDNDADEPLPANIPQDSARGNGDRARQRSVGGMEVGASKKSGNSFYDVGNANYDSGGGSTSTTVEYATPYASASGDIGMDAGASKKSENNFYDVGNANYDSGGGHSSTTAEYAIPYESACGDTGSSLHHVMNNGDYDTRNVMAYSSTVGAISYEPLPASTNNDGYDTGNAMSYSTTVGAIPYETLPSNTDVEA